MALILITYPYTQALSHKPQALVISLKPLVETDIPVSTTIFPPWLRGIQGDTSPQRMIFNKY